MSLINKVLRDLETQREAPPEAAARHSPLVNGELQAVRPVKPRLSGQQLLRVGLLLALAAVGAFAWMQWGTKPRPVPRMPVTSPTVPPPATTAVKPSPEAPKADAPTARPAEPVTVAKTEAPKPVEPAAKLSTPPPAPAPARDVVVRKPQAESVKTETTVVPAVPLAETSAKIVTAKAKEPVPTENPEAEAVDAEPATTSGPDVAEPKEPAVAKPAGKPRHMDVPSAVPRDAKTVLDKKIRPLTPEDRAENEYRLAAAALQQRRTGEAESRLRTALAAQPGHVKARELLAGLLLQGGHWREAQSQLEQGLTLNPAHYPFAQLLARSYVDHGQEGKALELLEKKREAAGGDADYFAFLATLYQRAGRHDDAIRAFGEALGKRPQEGRWWLGLAISLEAVEKWKEATEAYQRAAASGSLDKQLLQYSQRRLAVVRNK